MSSIISLTFDDGIHQHLDHAIPILNEYGLKGTFYVHLSAESLACRMQEWREASMRGHELGNHTIFHPATKRKKWVTAGNAIEDYSLDRMRLELQVANDWLSAIDEQTFRTFAYPCSNAFVGHRGLIHAAIERSPFRRTRVEGWFNKFGMDIGSSLQSYKPLMKDFFAAARGGGLELTETPPALSKFDRWSLPSAAISGESWNVMRDFVTRSIESNTWGILQFHGIAGGHHMDCRIDDFREFCRWLSENHADRVRTIISSAKQIWPEVGPVADNLGDKA